MSCLLHKYDSVWRSIPQLLHWSLDESTPFHIYLPEKKNPEQFSHLHHHGRGPGHGPVLADFQFSWHGCSMSKLQLSTSNT